MRLLANDDTNRNIGLLTLGSRLAASVIYQVAKAYQTE